MGDNNINILTFNVEKIILKFVLGSPFKDKH